MPPAITTNTFYQLLGKVFTTLAAVLTISIIARSLGPESLGTFTKATVFASLFYMLADFGFNAIFLKNNPDNERFKENYGNLMGVRIIAAIGLFLIATLVVLVLPFDPVKNSGFNQQAKIAAILANFTIITFALFTTSNAYFQFKLRYDLSVASSIFGSVTTIILVLIASQYFVNLNFYILASVVGSLVTTLVSLKFVFKFMDKFRPEFNFFKFKLLFNKTLPVGISLVLNLIYFRIDTILLSFFRPNFEVAVYGLAYKIFEFSLVAPTFFMNATYPLLINFYQNDKEKFKRLILRSGIVLLLISVLLSTLILISANILVAIIGGEQLLASSVPLRILVAGLPFFFLSSLSTWLFLVFGKQKYLVPVYGFGAFLNLILNFIYIPKFGYNAAAVVTVFCEFAILFATILILYKNRKTF